MPGILFDLDGVIYQGNQAIKGADKVIAWVKAQKIPYLFVTNTSSQPRSVLREKLAAFNIETDESHIFTPAVAAMQWLQQHVNNEKVALFVPELTKDEFRGLTICDEIDEDVAAVVVGDLGEQWNFKKLNKAFRLLMHDPQPRLIALGMTRYWQAGDGLRLDVAPFVTALTHATDIKPLVLGKPAKMFFTTAIQMLGEDQSDTFMIGDDIRGDVEGAQKAGLKSILVRTGKFRLADLELAIQPEAILNSIDDLPDWWEANIK